MRFGDRKVEVSKSRGISLRGGDLKSQYTANISGRGLGLFYLTCWHNARSTWFCQFLGSGGPSNRPSTSTIEGFCLWFAFFVCLSHAATLTMLISYISCRLYTTMGTEDMAWVWAGELRATLPESSRTWWQPLRFRNPNFRRSRFGSSSSNQFLSLLISRFHIIGNDYKFCI